MDDEDICYKENSFKESIKRLLTRAIEDRTVYSQDKLKDELQDWIGAKIIYKALVEAGRHYNAQDWKGAASKIQQAYKDYQKSAFEIGVYKGFSELDDLVEGVDPKTLISLGCQGLDEALLPGVSGGGARRGDQTVLIASVNTGKTLACESIVANNVVFGKDALIVSHEGTRQALRRQMLRCLARLMSIEKFSTIWAETEMGANLPKEDLLVCSSMALDRLRKAIPDEIAMGRLLMARTDPVWHEYKDDAAVLVLQVLASYMDKHCVHLSRNIAGQTVEEVGAVIRQHQEMWGEIHGKGFDVFLDDYPQKLTTQQAMGGKYDPYQVKGHVYDYFVSLADEMKWHSIVPDQTNMEGSKINKGISKESRLLQQEDIGRGWEPVKTATNIFTLNRSPKAQELGYMIWQLCKSRSSGTGLAIVTKTDFAWSLTHSNELGWMSYLGQSERFNQIDKFLLQTPANRRLTKTDGGFSSI